MKDIFAVFRQFPTDGEPLRMEQIKSGHINETFLIETDTGAKYILQGINQYVFPNVAAIMHNMSAITAHLRRLGEGERAMIHYIDTRDGAAWYDDGDGGAWRIYRFVDNSVCHQYAESAEDFYESARAFGSFQYALRDFPAEQLEETIANFHNTVDRYGQFRRAVEEDVCGRLASVRPEVDFVLKREERACVLQHLREQGMLPVRATHNDTKINNVLLDDATGEGICVIDLDTLMPGSALYDFGDMVRSATLNMAEDSKDYKNVVCRRDIFEALAKGFVEAGDFLNAAEIGNMTFGGLLMTLECGVRFLTDYLDGDHYFKIHRPEHNLDRCRTQFALVKSIQDEYDQLQGFVDGLRR